MKRSQAGLAVVEFAFVVSFAIIVLFGCLEVGRFFFVYNTVAEATRRGARVAVVTGDVALAKAATLAYSDYVKDMDADNVSVVFYTETGGVPTGLDDTALVTVSITGYEHSPLIPFLPISPIQVPAFTTTLPVESMGIPAA